MSAILVLWTVYEELHNWQASYKFDQGKARRDSCILGLIHISGPLPNTSLNFLRYVITFIDDFSRFTWVYFLKNKS